MQRFPEFQALARRWPGNFTPRYRTWQLEYEACLLMGCTEDEIIEGTRYWLDNCIPQDTSNFYPLAPHNFLREQSFLAYQPVDKSSSLRVISST